MLLANVTLPESVKIPPPSALDPDVLLPLNVLLASESTPLDKKRIPPPLWVVSRG